MLCNIANLEKEILAQALRDAAQDAARRSGGRCSSHTGIRAVAVVYGCTEDALQAAGLRRLEIGEWPAANVVVYVDNIGSCYTLKEGE